MPKVVVSATVRLALVACTASASVAGCALLGSSGWRSPYGVAHPLVGYIYDVAGQAYVTQTELAGRLAEARFVLLGEQHDNVDHHRLQARVIRALVARERTPAVVMEMLDTDDTVAIQQCLATRRCSARRLAEAVDWQGSGWPSWRIYEPVLRAALDAGLVVAPGSLPSAAVRDYARTGQLDAPLATPLPLDDPLDPALAAAMAEEIHDSHCGHAPESMIDGMVAAQRLRDLHMAESVLLAAPLGRAVLIAGFGHTRNDRPLAAALRAAEPDDPTVSLAFVEVDDAILPPWAYAERFATETLPFDYVWFTPRSDDSDPCERFREQLRDLGRVEQREGRPLGN